jgi:hypothetical protein
MNFFKMCQFKLTTNLFLCHYNVLIKLKEIHSLFHLDQDPVPKKFHSVIQPKFQEICRSGSEASTFWQRSLNLDIAPFKVFLKQHMFFVGLTSNLLLLVRFPPSYPYIVLLTINVLRTPKYKKIQNKFVLIFPIFHSPFPEGSCCSLGWNTLLSVGHSWDRFPEQNCKV